MAALTGTWLGERTSICQLVSFEAACVDAWRAYLDAVFLPRLFSYCG